jgi:hypothetical protein
MSVILRTQCMIAAVTLGIASNRPHSSKAHECNLGSGPIHFGIDPLKRINWMPGLLTKRGLA